MLQDLQGQALRRVSAFAESRRPWVNSVALAVALGVAYFLAARFSLALLTKPDGVAVFWPAAGVAAGVLIAIGPSARWPVVAGAIAATIVANLLGDRSIWSAVVFAVCNAGEAVIVAGLIERYFGPAFSLDTLRQVLGLLVAAIIGTAISGIGGALGLSYSSIFGRPAPDHMASLVYLRCARHRHGRAVADRPVLGGARSAAASRIRRGRCRAVRADLVERGDHLPAAEPWATVVPIALLFPLLLWLAARCRPVFSAAAAFIVALTIVWTTTFGIGIFGDATFPIAERVLSAQAGILAVALCAFVLAALFTERRKQEAELTASEARLQEALTAGGVTAFDWDVGSDLSQRSANAALILGFDPKRDLSGAAFLALVHPDDRSRLTALVRSIRPDEPSFDVTFRFVRPDGQEIWLEQTAKGEFDPKGRLKRIKGLTVDMTERKHAEERQDLLIAELDHRVKNVLARVAVVAMQTREGSTSMSEFVKALDGRIQSMAAAHSLLSQSRWHGVGLADLVRDQLAPYATARKRKSQRSKHHAFRRGDAGGRDGAARTGDQCGEIRCAIEARRQSVGRPGTGRRTRARSRC